MTEGEQKAAEIAKAEAKAKAEAEEKANAEFEASLEGLSEEEKTQKRAEKEAEHSQIDYEAELKREKERSEAAEKAVADTAFKLREEKRGRKEDAEARGETFFEEPLTRKELEELLQKDRQQTRRELQLEIIAEKATKLTGNEAEKNLIIEIHKNRIWPEGMSLDDQLEESHAIANRKAILARNAELKRALQSKDTKSNDATSSHIEPPTVNEPQSSADLQAIKSTGYKWDGKLGLFIKQLRGKRVLTYDPKTKAQKVIERE